MKKVLILAVIALFGITVFAENKTVSFSVNPPLVCNNCENKVKDNIRFEKGVKSVKPSAKKALVELTYDDTKTDVPTLIAAFKKIGYDAMLIEAQVCPENTDGACCGKCKATVTEDITVSCCNGNTTIEETAASCCNGETVIEEATVSSCPSQE